MNPASLIHYLIQLVFAHQNATNECHYNQARSKLQYNVLTIIHNISDAVFRLSTVK